MPDTLLDLYRQNKQAKVENDLSAERSADGSPMMYGTKYQDIFNENLASPLAFNNQTGVSPIGEYSSELPNAGLTSAEGDINYMRAAAQSGSDQMFNAAKRLIPNVILGTIGNLASIADVEDYANFDDEIGNPIEKATDSMMAWINEKAPIYRKNPAESFNFSDSGYVWENVSQLANSVGAFALTGFITGGLLSAASEAVAGKAGIAALEASAKARAAKLLNMGKLEASAVPDFIKADVAKRLYLAPTILNAGALNQAEGIMEAVPQYREVYKMKLDKGFSKDEAIKAASDAADVSLMINRANILSNLTSAGLFTGARSAITKAMGGVAKSVAIESGQEALEEGVNYIAQMESSLKGEQGDAFKYDLRRSVERLGEEKGLESMMLGAVGGAGSTIVTHTAVPAWERVKGGVSDLVEAAALSGKKSTVDKFNDTYKQFADIHNYITNSDVDEDIDGFASEIAVNSIASDAKNSEEGGEINLSGTKQKLAVFESILNDENASKEQKAKAKAGIDSIKNIIEVAKTANLSGRENAADILSTIVGMKAVDARIEDLNKLIDEQKTLPQNQKDGVLDEEKFAENTKDISAAIVQMEKLRAQLKEDYDNYTSEETKQKLKDAKEAKKEEVKNGSKNKNAKKNAKEATSGDGDIKVKTPDGGSITISGGITKRTSNSPADIVPSVMAGNGKSIHELFGLREATTDPDEIARLQDENQPLDKKNASISNDQFKSITGIEFDHENPSIHLIKEDGKDGANDKYYIAYPNASGTGLLLTYLDKAKDNNSALLLAAKKAASMTESIKRTLTVGTDEKGKKLENNFSQDTPGLKLVLGDIHVPSEAVSGVLERLNNGEELDISEAFNELGELIIDESTGSTIEEDDTSETEVTLKKSKVRVISQILKDSKERTGMVGKKRIEVPAINYLAMRYTFVKDGKGRMVIKDNPDGVNDEFINNSDHTLTQNAKLTFKIAEGKVKVTLRDKKGHPILSDDGTPLTREITADEAIADNKQYGEHDKIELPIAIYSGDTLLGYVPEYAWLEERDDDNARIHIAEPESKSKSSSEERIRNDIEDIKSLREKFVAEAKAGNKTFSMESVIESVGDGVIFSLEQPMPLFESAPNLAKDVEFLTGSSDNLWGYMKGGRAYDIHNNVIANSAMANLDNGTPVVMVPTAAGRLSPQILYGSGIGSNTAKSILSAVKAFEKNKGKDALYNLGVRYFASRGINTESMSIDKLRRMGLRAYVSQYLHISKSGKGKFSLRFDDNEKFVLSWNSESAGRQYIKEGVAVSNSVAETFVEDFSKFNYNFSQQALADDKNPAIKNDVIFINEDLTAKSIANSFGEFYLGKRNVKFKPVGKIGSGETERSVYFLQPVLEFKNPLKPRKTVPPVAKKKAAPVVTDAEPIVAAVILDEDDKILSMPNLETIGTNDLSYVAEDSGNSDSNGTFESKTTEGFASTVNLGMTEEGIDNDPESIGDDLIEICIK